MLVVLNNLMRSLMVFGEPGCTLKARAAGTSLLHRLGFFFTPLFSPFPRRSRAWSGWCPCTTTT